MSGKRLVPLEIRCPDPGQYLKGFLRIVQSFVTDICQARSLKSHSDTAGLCGFWRIIQWGWPVTRYILTVTNAHPCGGRWQEHHPSHFVLVAEQSGSSKRLGLSLWSSCAINNGSGWKGYRAPWPIESEVVSHPWIHEYLRWHINPTFLRATFVLAVQLAKENVRTWPNSAWTWRCNSCVSVIC